MRLASSQLLWRIGIASDILMHIFDIPLMVILYILLRPVNKDLAMMEVFFKLAQSAILVASKLNLFTPLFLTGDAHYLSSYAQRFVGVEESHPRNWVVHFTYDRITLFA